MPAVAFGAYLWLGSPDIESQPFAERIGEPGDTAEGQAGRLPDVETMMARLRGRLAEDPDDLQGWIGLGQTSMLLGCLSALQTPRGSGPRSERTEQTRRSAIGQPPQMESRMAARG